MNQLNQPVIRPSFFSTRNVILAAGLAFLAPYIIRRVLPLLQGDTMNQTPNDYRIAGKDAVRDAADDLGIGGLTGTLKRGIGRVADRLN